MMRDSFPNESEAASRFSILPISEERKVPASFYGTARKIFDELRGGRIERAYELLEGVGTVTELKAVLICLDYDLVSNVRSRRDLLDRVRGANAYRGFYKDYFALLGNLLAKHDLTAAENCRRDS